MPLQNTMKALADPTRRTILNILKKDADLIRDRRQGKYIFYELNASVLDEALLWIKDLRGDWYEKIVYYSIFFDNYLYLRDIIIFVSHAWYSTSSL